MQIEREWSGRAVAAAFTRYAKAAGRLALPLATATNMRLPPGGGEGDSPRVNQHTRSTHPQSRVLALRSFLNFEGGFLNFFKFFSVLFYGK